MGVSNPNSRNTIYFDESGVPSLKDKGQFFILTGVIANNLEFSQLSEYYLRLKIKYFKAEEPIHSFKLFWQPKPEEISFISELVRYLDTIPFTFLTTVIDKKAILKSKPLIPPQNHFLTNFSQAKSLWVKKGHNPHEFSEKTIKEILKIVKTTQYPVNNYYPLRIAYYTILKQYLKCNYGSEFEICFETSPNREKILKYTEEFYQERNSRQQKTIFAKKLKEQVYSISFPNKSAKYLGLEIADIISYGFSLSKYHRINKLVFYKEIWQLIHQRQLETEKTNGIKCIYSLPKKRGADPVNPCICTW
jgi:hypothetical protein